ncbi:MAG: hypothetical protein QOI85_1527 [Chloroflexota bacterium]|jgi:hypothetical protein|nr:hypothetical protein [Chloroflexota bacterium]
MTNVELAAIAAAVLLTSVSAFQVALAAGLPLGEATMGGRASTVDGVLEPQYRVIAVGSAIVLLLTAWIVLARAGTLPAFLSGQALVWTAWVVVGFLAMNTLTNLSGRHPLERWGMASITLLAGLLVGYVAFAAPA